MRYHVIDSGPSVAHGGYVMPGGVAPDSAGQPEALPRGEDAQVGAGDAAATIQPMWGWGDAPAFPTSGEGVAMALTRLPSNPTLYTARQQDAARRDIAARLGSYAEYQPQPFISSQKSVAGSQCLEGRYTCTATDIGTEHVATAT